MFNKFLRYNVLFTLCSFGLFMMGAINTFRGACDNAMIDFALTYMIYQMMNCQMLEETIFKLKNKET